MGNFLNKIFLFLFLSVLPSALLADKGYGSAPARKLETLWDGEFVAGKPVSGTIIIRDTASGEPLTIDNLKFYNKRQIHLWLIDPSYTDLQHLHPISSDNSYNFNFTFTPKVSGSYRIFTEILPFSSDKKELLSGWMGEKELPFAERAESYTNSMDGYIFSLAFDAVPRVGITSTAIVNVTDSYNKPAKWAIDSIAKPYSQTEYFRIIGFHDDNETVFVSTQEVPADFYAGQFYGPTVQFKITPERAGFVKMFLCATINGKEMFIPFGFFVQKQ